VPGRLCRFHRPVTSSNEATALMDPRQTLYQDEWFRSRVQIIEKALLVLLDREQSGETEALRAEVVRELRVSLGLEQETATN
jgi:hypothetical protein